MQKSDLTKLKLPDNPGVYFFRSKDGDILYIGRATSLSDRVKSYFSNDLISTRSSRIVDMVTLADTVTWQETDSVLEAIILEASLIKKHQPSYNVKEKDNKSFNYVVITDEDFPRVLIERGRTIEKLEISKGARNVYGPFVNGSLLRQCMKIIRKIFPYRDTCTPANSNADSSPLKPNRPCFNAQIGLCPGVCSGAISAVEYKKTIRRIEQLLSGKKADIIKDLEKEMKAFARDEKFEQASQTKKLLESLLHIQDVALIKNDNLYDEVVAEKAENQNENDFRIEAYDVAHISGKSMVSVMVVSKNGEIDKNSYRKFKIKTVQGANEVESLTETLNRRFAHTEWKMPNLIVVDGNDVQRNATKKVLNKLFEDSPGSEKVNIPVLSIVKDNRNKAREVLGVDRVDIKIKEVFGGSENLIKHITHLNSEAHRFAIAYHRLVRGKDSLGIRK